MVKIKRVGVFSAGKVFGALYGLLGLIVGGIFTCVGLMGAAAFATQGDEEWIGALFSIGAVIVFPIFYGIMGFIGGIIMALLYNLIAGLVGGIEVETE